MTIVSEKPKQFVEENGQITKDREMNFIYNILL